MKKLIVGIIALSAIAAIYHFITPSAAIVNRTPSGGAIVCFGDSLTYGTGASKGMDYPAQLSRMIGLPVMNAGVPGDTTTRALKRLNGVLDRQPRVVLITLGGNDLKNGISRQTAFDNLRAIIRSVQAEGALVIIGGIEIPFYGKGFGGAYRELAEETGSVLIPNVFDGIMGTRSLMSDPIHPNSQGYTVMAQHFYRALQPYL
ncbi:arylesterase [Desulfosarcina sp.]|uniref:arylesterase n=1 Tax=Desulfosarcina sp. TaxID=2027861 RepID=UPI0029B520FA|nr:arylesterase [Desulfosarcina sp.]MDX2451828.1 arylesterase [Desulfosarcina sp.]MDX2489612.1 arylesterase [Desulfosarcina sp.]